MQIRWAAPYLVLLLWTTILYFSALSNPFVEDQSHLRPTLVTGLLEALKLNQSRGVVASRLFETGRIFIERNGQNFECVAVAFVVAEPVGERSWLKVRYESPRRPSREPESDDGNQGAAVSLPGRMR